MKDFYTVTDFVWYILFYSLNINCYVSLCHLTYNLQNYHMVIGARRKVTKGQLHRYLGWVSAIYEAVKINDLSKVE